MSTPAVLSSGSGELPAEEQARVNFYALLAHLYYRSPNRALLDALAGADGIVVEARDSVLAPAWRDLASAAATADEEQVRADYEETFVGTGKARVPPYAGAYLPGSAADRSLVALREFLGARGLGRRESVHEPENHIAALLDVMRHLIVEQPEDIAPQRDFFMRFLWPVAPGFCDAAGSAAQSDFYKAAARLAKCFFELEHTALEMQA